MEDSTTRFTKNRWVAYGTLVTAISTGIAVILTALGDYQTSVNPYARPDAFTSSDFDEQSELIKSDLRRDFNVKIANLQYQVTELAGKVEELRVWRNNHNEWGIDLSLENERWKGKIESEHEQFHRILRLKE